MHAVCCSVVVDVHDSDLFKWKFKQTAFICTGTRPMFAFTVKGYFNIPFVYMTGSLFSRALHIFDYLQLTSLQRNFKRHIRFISYIFSFTAG